MDNINIEVMEVGAVVIQELWNRVATGTQELLNETNNMAFGKESFREFSKQLTELNVLFQALHARRMEIKSSELTRIVLERLHSQLKKGSKIIREYKSGSQLRLIMKAHSVHEQMNGLVKEIAETISSLQLANLDATLNLKSKTQQIINNLRTIEFQTARATEAIASEIDKLMTQNGQDREYIVNILHKIAEAFGANVNASLVQNELALLKAEKENMEVQKKQAEAFQLSQLIQLLYDSELVPHPPEEHTTSEENYIESFTCPLSHELMTDPVAILCGHSFQRRAIEEYFTLGMNTCPTCKDELPSQELMPNISLQGSISEWKQTQMDMKFQTAVSGIDSSDHDILNKALHDLQALLEVLRYRDTISEEGLISKIVKFIKPNSPNAPAALKCLYHLSLCEANKEAILQAGAVHYIIKRLYRGEAEPEAMAILLELSAKETHAEKIGNVKNSIPLLVSLLHNSNPDASRMSKEVLQNLSWNTHFVVKMAEAGYFPPFIVSFIEGPIDARASMAADLVKMQIGDNNIENFEDKLFIRKLIQMLSNSPACRMACIKCIKKLIVYKRMVKLFLEDDTTISHLIGLISYVKSEEHCKLEATELLTSLIEISQTTDFERYPKLQELQSTHNINLFTRLVANSDPQSKAHFLQLLLVLAHKSETARNLIRSDKSTIAKLFSCLCDDRPEVRQKVMKLIYCISEDHPAGVPLPASPAKEHAINALVTILTSSADVKEKTTAAGIISHLPANDITVDGILSRSNTLKVIHEVICTSDDELCRINPPIGSDESLLENALAILIRYTQPNKPELQRQICELELHTPLVRVLSRGSSLAKQRTALALAHLSQSTNLSITNAATISNQENNSVSLHWLNKILPGMSWCWSALAPNRSMCPVHGTACSSRNTFCLVKADAVGPLLQILSDTRSGAADAALIALNTLLKGHDTQSHAATAIVNNQGVAAILEVLERGTLSAKDKALNLLQRILQHNNITNSQSKRAERILIQLLSEDALKKNAALVLRQMNLLPEQSSYF